MDSHDAPCSEALCGCVCVGGNAFEGRGRLPPYRPPSPWHFQAVPEHAPTLPGVAVDDLERFVTAQEQVYAHVLAELRRGRKTSHWMWFIFPQVAGLGHSPVSVRFAIQSIEEARGYLAHPVLGPRLRECAEAVLAVKDRTAEDVFGPIDAKKLRSCMTLFHRAAPTEPLFRRVLDDWFGGMPDDRTDLLLGIPAASLTSG
jgi:uncharacterized protein (DUF1810 family)